MPVAAVTGKNEKGVVATVPTGVGSGKRGISIRCIACLILSILTLLCVLPGCASRLLSYVYLADGTMFNETLLREGYAQVATFPPNMRYVDRFEEAQEEASEARRGI